jgi:hypothetical protein
MTIRNLIVGLLLLTTSALARPVAAEEGAPDGDTRAKIKKKMEEILGLMRENEEALLALSTGGDARTRRVDVEVPEGDEPPPRGAAGAQGGEAEERLRELIGGSRRRGEQIPEALGELVRMIPPRQGGGQGRPDDGPPPGSDAPRESGEPREGPFGSIGPGPRCPHRPPFHATIWKTPSGRQETDHEAAPDRLGPRGRHPTLGRSDGHRRGGRRR